MDYLFLTESGTIVGADGSSKKVETNTTNKPDIIWASSECLTLLEVAIPTRNQTALEQSVPYAVEDSILGEIDTMHYAWYATAKGKPLPLAVVEKDIMNIWKLSLQKAGLRATKLVPDIFLAPWIEGQWTLLILEERTILRTGEFHGVSGSHAWIADYISNNTITLDAIQAIRLPGVSVSKIWKKYNPISGEEAKILLDSKHRSNRIINLLQGAYGGWLGISRVLHTFYLPIAAAAIISLLIVGQEIVRYIELNAEKEHISQLVTAQAQRIVKDYNQGDPLRPLVTRRIDQLKQKVSMRASSSWTVLEKATPLLANCSNCAYETIRLEKGGFSFQTGSYNALTPLEKIIKSLQSYKVTTKINTTQRKENPYYRLNVNIQSQK